VITTCLAWFNKVLTLFSTVKNILGIIVLPSVILLGISYLKKVNIVVFVTIKKIKISRPLSQNAFSQGGYNI